MNRTIMLNNGVEMPMEGFGVFQDEIQKWIDELKILNND